MIKEGSLTKELFELEISKILEGAQLVESNLVRATELVKSRAKVQKLLYRYLWKRRTRSRNPRRNPMPPFRRFDNRPLNYKQAISSTQQPIGGPSSAVSAVPS